MTLKPSQIGIGTMFLALILCSPIGFAQTTGTAQTTLNFRASPNGKDLRTNIRPGEKFKVLDSNSSWVKIKRSNGRVGWIWKKHVNISSSKPTQSSKNKNQKVDSSISQSAPVFGELKNVEKYLNIRQKPSSRSRDNGNLKPGEEFEIIGDAENGWYKVKSKSGVVGYASDEYIVKKETATIDDSEVVRSGGIPIPEFRPDTPEVAKADADAKEIKQQTAEEARTLGARLEAIKELKGPFKNVSEDVLSTGDDSKIEAECDACLAQAEIEDQGPTRSLMDIGSKVYDFHTKEMADLKVPIIAGKCTIGSRFGPRFHPVLKYSRPHTGQDVKTNRQNLPLRSPMKGVVVSSGKAGGYGNQIKIKLENGITVSYNHMQSRSKFKRGQAVSAGTVVGKSGTTGLSTGIHLHLETFNSKGKRIDPLKVFKRSEICGSARD